MRFDRVIFTITLCGLFACDPDPPGTGSADHGCYSWTNGCDDGLRCVDGTCVSCGGNGEPCCWADTGKPCEGGLACDKSSDAVGMCQDDCGLGGKPCCADGTCPGGGACDESNTCGGAAPGDACFSGSTPHDVAVVDSNCGMQVITLWTKTDADAETCRQQMISGAAPGFEVCPLDTKPDTALVCQNDWGPLYLWHCSDQQVAVCEYNLCVNGCTYTDPDANDHCPLGP